MEYRFDGGVTWTAYTTGSPLITTGHTSVDIRTYRTATGPGCTLSSTVMVSWTVNAVPVSGTLTPTIAAGAVCTGASIKATATAGSGGAGTIADVLQYKVNGGSWTSYIAGDFISTFSRTSVEIQTYRTATGSGCSSSTPVVLSWTVNSTLTASISIAASPSGAICTGTSVTFTATPVNGGTTPTFQWYKNTLAVASGATYTYVPADGDQVYVVMTSDLACTTGSPATSNTTTITVNPLPQGSLTSSGPFCTTGSGQLTWTATSGTGPFTVIYIDGTADRTVNSVVSGTAFDTFTTPVTSTTTYSLVSVTDANSCVRSSSFTASSVTITINQSPVADAPSNVTACDSYTLPALINGNYFSAAGGTGPALSAGNKITSTQTIYVYSPGTAPCVAAEHSFTVTINQSPVAAITNNTGSTVLTCTTTNISVTATGGVNYSWFNGATEVGTSATLSITAPGTYTVIATAANGCTDTEAVSITQNIAAPIDASISSVTTVLNSTTTMIKLTTSASDNSSSSNLTYLWSTGATTVAIDVTTAAKYTVTITDPDNGCTTTASKIITQDAGLPAIPTVVSQTTNDTTPLITGTATVASGETLKVTVNGVTYTAGDGRLTLTGTNWSLQIPAGSEILNGTYSVTAKVTDAAGNSSTDTTANELIIDTIAPAISMVVSQTTNDTTPLITGTATVASGETLKVTVNGVTYIAGDGKLTLIVTNWSLQIPSGSEIVNGTYEVTATVTDQAGNSVSDITTDELTIDTTVPIIPTVVSQITKETTPLITGTAIVALGEMLRVIVNGVTYTAGDGKLTLIGTNWSLQIPSESEILNGTYEVTATVTDQAGNSASDITANELTIDTTAPSIPTVVSQITNDTTPLITGTATVASGETLNVIVNGITYTTGDGRLTLTGTNWSLQIPAGSEILNGTYSVMAIVTDAAGNSSTDSTDGELIIDTVAPSIPTVVSQTTNDTTPLITGTATVASGETLSVTVNGITYIAADGKLTIIGTIWSLQIPAGSEILNGTYSVTAKVTDAAGNSSSDSTANELTIDTIAPAIPTVVTQTTNDTTPLITGTATVAIGETLNVTVNGITYTVGNGHLTLTGSNWNLQIPDGSEILDGTYSVTAKVTDAAGNSNTDSTSGELIIDTVAPAIPTVVSQTSKTTIPIISGTTTVAVDETLKVTVNGITYTAGDGNLTLAGTNWSLQIPTGNEILDGVYPVTAIVTDAAGNSSADQTTDELTIDTVIPPVAKILGPAYVTVGNCNVEGIVLDGSMSLGDGLTYSWTPSDYLDNAASSKPLFHPGKSTRYTLTVTNSKGLKDTTSVMVSVITAPKVVTDKNVFVDAPTATILLNGAKSTGSGLTYLWSSKDGNILNGNIQPTATVSGLGMYYLQVTDSFGCSDRDSVSIGLYTQAINDTAQTKVNESVVINVLRNDIPQGPIDPSSISIVTPPLHGFAEIVADSMILYTPEQYYVGQDDFVYSICDQFRNCDNAKVMLIINDIPLFIPEAFSPNGDGINDKFQIKGLAKYKTVQIEIFNRWGNIVYQSNNYGDGIGKSGFWDGTASSGMRVGTGPVPSGTYYCVLTLNGNEKLTKSVYLDR